VHRAEGKEKYGVGGFCGKGFAGKRSLFVRVQNGGYYIF